MLHAVSLAEIVTCSQHVAGTRSRKEKIALLSACLRRLSGQDVLIGVAYLSGSMRQGRIGIGYATVVKVTPPPASEASLELADVDGTFSRIGETKGKGSAAEKVRLLGQLLERATADEQTFLRRLLFGELRQGANEGILVEAIAAATETPPAAVRRAAMLSGTLDLVAQAAFAEGQAGLARFDIELFRPLQPMLAQTSETPTDALDQLSSAMLDFKMDGARIQVHKRGDDICVFTRRLKVVTPAVPEVVEQVRRFPARELVIDGEVLALFPDGRPHPFQTTMRRFGRKLDVAKVRQELPLSPFYFDILYADGQTLVDKSTAERGELLAELTHPDAVIPRLVTDDPEAAEAFLDRALEAGHEGIMAKALDAVYAAGSRGADWLKIKPAHTLDLVVLAAEWGHGRRQGWLSNLHLGARNPDGSFCMLGKTFKGMTDATLRWQTEELQKRALGQEGHVVHVRPELVVEIAVSDIQTSPHYPGGLALRFARLKRYRGDKRAGDADTIETVRRLHQGGASDKRRRD
jgi:ATP-dependent DNA ligase I